MSFSRWTVNQKWYIYSAIEMNYWYTITWMNLKTLCREKKAIKKGYKVYDSAYVMTQLQTGIC